MRIIAGKWGSRELEHPDASITRPMPDRVKQAMFDMLGVRFECPGELPSIRVGDFFAGSGSLGLEALSRGAKHCWFFERHREALDVLRNNITTLDAVPVSTIVPGDAWRCNFGPEPLQTWNLVFLDPPYRDALDATENGLVRRFMFRISSRSAPSAMLVLHHPVEVDYAGGGTGDWTVVTSRRFGTNGVTFFQR